MYQNEKIGVGIITCNRKESCQQLFNQVRINNDVDSIIIIKDKNFNYSDFINDIKNDNKSTIINIIQSKGVGYCKNQAFKYLLNQKCQHIFLIEDDTSIINNNVFKQYIDIAKCFNVEHLSFGGCSPFFNWRKPICQISNGNYAIDFYHHIKGEFCYYTANALQMVGLMDEQYINAIEHIEHTYRLMKFGFCCGCFWAFPDIANSEKFLYNSSCEQKTYQGTIDAQSTEQKINVQNAYAHFADVYHCNFGFFKQPNFETIKTSVIQAITKNKENKTHD